MQLTIITKELNQPSTKALKEFNQYVFEVTQQHYKNQEQNQGEVTSHE
jgi:hypothetical protein